LAQLQLAIDRFTWAQKVARTDAHLLDQLAQLLFVQRLNVIVDLAEVDTPVDKKLIHLATFRASWFFVNCDFVCHSIQLTTKAQRHKEGTRQDLLFSSCLCVFVVNPVVTGISLALSSPRPRDRSPKCTHPCACRCRNASPSRELREKICPLSPRAYG